MVEHSKEAVRRRTRVLLRTLSPQYRAHASAGIIARVIALPQFQQPAAVLAFIPLTDEPDITPFLRRLMAAGRRVYAPAILATDWVSWRRLRSLDQLETNQLGFRQPSPEPHSTPLPGDAVALIPGLAFSRAGDRLGRGGGHYDRLLARHTGPRVGLAYQCQLTRQLPVAPHDEGVDVVVTEGDCFWGYRVKKSVHG